MSQSNGSNGAAAPNWSSKFAFIMAAVGSAVGLGNIWKFPYMAGEGGGGAFVLMYLGFVVLFTVPILVAELMLGRKAASDPISAMMRLGREHGGTPLWGLIGMSGVVAALFILSFYSVVAGWAVEYVPEMLSGSMTGATAETTGKIFGDLLASPTRMLIWHTVFMVMTVVIVAGGVTKGIEASVVWMMPALFVMLLFLLVYAMVEGEFARGIAYMFTPDFSKITVDVAIAAAGQAFFSLSVGIGTMLAYGSYLGRDISIPKTALIVGLSDTAVAIIAGCAIFPIMFAAGLEPGQGPGLVFVTLPVAFGNMSFGLIIGALFFVLLSVAALTSSISLLEPIVAALRNWLVLPRWVLSVGIGFVAWALGFLTIWSFNDWADVKLLGDRTVFDTIDYITSSFMLPLGGAAMAVFAGWVMKKEIVKAELSFDSELLFQAWYIAVRYLAPICVLAIAYQKAVG